MNPPLYREKLIEDDLNFVWADLSTLSLAAFVMSVIACHTLGLPQLKILPRSRPVKASLTIKNINYHLKNTQGLFLGVNGLALKKSISRKVVECNLDQRSIQSMQILYDNDFTLIIDIYFYETFSTPNLF